MNRIKEIRDKVQEEGHRGRIVIAYGAGRFAPSGPGRKAAPTTRAFKEFASRYDTYPVNEFRTSWVHHRTGEVLNGVQRRDTGATVRGLLWCSSTVQSDGKHFLKRDLNAAINIRRCLVSSVRPKELTRVQGSTSTPLKKAIGKVIAH